MIFGQFPIGFCLLLAMSSFCRQSASAEETVASRSLDVAEGCAATPCKPEPTGGNAEVDDSAGDFWNRPTLTGDWFGLRSSLQKSGITDLQYIRPGAGAIAADAFVYGLPVNTKFLSRVSKISAFDKTRWLSLGQRRQWLNLNLNSKNCFRLKDAPRP